jgi:hypothetical protein
MEFGHLNTWMVWALQHIPKGTNHDALEAGGDAAREATAGHLSVRTDYKNNYAACNTKI